MDSIRVGVIGTGALGRHHTRLYGECDGAAMVGVYDASAEAARRVADECSVRAFPTIDDLCGRVDAVSVAVPTDLHHMVVRPLLEKGKHVLVEKPIAQTVEQASDLVQLARENGVVLAVGHVERFNPVLACLSQIPGAPLFIEADRLVDYPPPRPGLKPRGTEVSVVLDLMIHDVDVILSLVDSEIDHVDAVGAPVLSDSEDFAKAHIAFKNGLVADLTASRVSKVPVRKLRVFKQAGYLSLDYGSHAAEVAMALDDTVSRRSLAVAEANALQLELQDFVDSVVAAKQGKVRPPRVSGEQGLRALRVATRILADIAARAMS
ncbi:MAG: Gfo/Idh/MocA family oxidoreductase [Lentisphaerae bacterium]|jgi:predicted dehydrogenase|nr:Gfo/Idh/MocA family oxidoreductase [Lentisphaerota bacterium]MBT4815625.1 Gfo/Idh/MocA family oxidoreductase [Lentisphaerota bacterium]MBT5611893.1 Gfo/Idh/MocA family oxidoreductase [Lentisphaerota bacterium]MBT7055510.1 Gfo/Idh/MocA family oxidoreductase [Lentisphaerota bacterium]MBT7847510.1 Gfo/Idh/MocA family oxidoreductase [Lentisphaerota bacterium]